MERRRGNIFQVIDGIKIHLKSTFSNFAYFVTDYLCHNLVCIMAFTCVMMLVMGHFVLSSVYLLSDVSIGQCDLVRSASSVPHLYLLHPSPL